ncbi:MAG: aconitate hydratase [Cenarchaeum sp. SB0663_bin_5]|nr:aconitate hydratase [Cenarchaeum sp. SB0663_bin_5]MYH04460.1 aconitate hydratase [Cenarchaeum sp. SB0675_bin_21]
MEIASTTEMVCAAYDRIHKNAELYRDTVKRPLTLTEKILAGHMISVPNSSLDGKHNYVHLKPDRVALQDVTGQMVMLQFMQAGLDCVALPVTVHCDHLIRARTESDSDMKISLNENNEVFEFLKSAAARYGCGFWKPGAGIIHQVVLENYAFPGGLMIGTDSHTPNAGGLGMIAVGVGGIDAAEVMAGLPWEVLYPRRIGVYLTGKLQSWASPKDVILKVLDNLSVSGGTNAIVEYFGPGVSSISCTGKATITNMGAEMGATCSIFPYDARMETYLKSTNRAEIANLANQNRDILVPDAEVESDPSAYYSEIIYIDLSELEPHIAGPHTPDLTRPISLLSDDVVQGEYTDVISVALVGSCTNSSYEDMSRAASIARQAHARGVISKVPLLVTPGSEQIRSTIQRDGQMQSLMDIGATVLANACGPCIGQWSRPELKQDETNSIITSFNRNFPGRNDGRRNTLNFIGSPEIVIAMALGGRLSFNPLQDTLESPDGTSFMLEPPPVAPEVPEGGFETPTGVYVPPPKDGINVDVIIDPASKRLQRIQPFEAWDGKDMANLRLLVKARGKCTTDHISPAGLWLSFRGHLDNLSDNMLLGAVNDYTGEVGTGKNLLTDDVGDFSTIAREYQKAGLRWIIVGDENYGEGSSREHAAMTPRYLGCVAVIARSFARIHETNLKKQGVLALTFADKSDYDKMLEDDHISITGLLDISPGNPVSCVLHHSSGDEDTISLNHSYSQSQLEWFRAGSALNTLNV